MMMSDFLNGVSLFAYGFLFGFFWYPIWKIINKIISEAKKTKAGL